MNPKKKKLIAFAGVILVIGLLAYDHLSLRFPVDRFGHAVLGMNEVDVTLIHGEPPNSTELSADGNRKVLTYLRWPETIDYIFLRERNLYTLVRICNDHYTPFNAHSPHSSGELYKLNGETTLRELTGRLGKPSNVSINRDGTRKILSFTFSNLAFEVHRDVVIRSCVGRDLPARYHVEYSG